MTDFYEGKRGSYQNLSDEEGDLDDISLSSRVGEEEEDNDGLEFTTSYAGSGGLKFDAYPAATPPQARRAEQPQLSSPAMHSQQQYGVLDLGSSVGEEDDDINLSDDMDLMGDNGKSSDDFFGVAPPQHQAGAGDDGDGGLPGKEAPGKEEGTVRMWHAAYYRHLFRVDTMLVLRRLLKTVLPGIGEGFLEFIKGNPDMYGTFWIPTTLIFLMAVTGNFATYLDLALDGKGSKWSYTFWKVVWGALAIYGYVLILPLCLWGFFKWREVDVPFLDNLCLYGYSLFVYVPISVLCVIPSDIARWILLPVAALWVCIFLAKGYWIIFDKHRKEGAAVMITVMLCNIGLMLAFRLYFFEYQD